MKRAIAVLTSLFVSGALAGCGGATIPEPPAGAKIGPPPGSSPELAKKIEAKKK